MRRRTANDMAVSVTDPISRPFPCILAQAAVLVRLRARSDHRQWLQLGIVVRRFSSNESPVWMRRGDESVVIQSGCLAASWQM